MNVYALRHKRSGELMSFTARGYDGDVGYELEEACGDTKVWVVTDRAVAETAAKTSATMDSSCYYAPVNGYVGWLEVVELGLV